MKKMLALAFVLAFSSTAISQEKPKFFLNDDGSVELRLAKVEAKLDNLETRVTALEKSYLPPLKSTPATKAVASNGMNCGEYGCPSNGGTGCTCKACACTNVSPRLPVGHTHTDSKGHVWDHSMDGGSHLCPFCGEKAVIVDNSTKLVNAPLNGNAAITSGTTSFLSSGGCANGQCSSGRSTGWYLGKRLGR